jgi:hypothetical protein
MVAGFAKQSDASKNRLILRTNRLIPARGCGGSAMAGQSGFFDGEERLKALSAAGDPLERLTAVVDFEVFRSDLERALARAGRSKGGRSPTTRY